MAHRVCPGPTTLCLTHRHAEMAPSASALFFFPIPYSATSFLISELLKLKELLSTKWYHLYI